MAATTYRPRTAQDETPLRRRASGLALAIAIEVLLILAFLTLDFRPARPEFKGGSISVFDLPGEEQADSSQSEAQPTRAIPEVPHPVLPPVKPTITPRPLPILEVDKAFLDAADISRLGNNAPGARLAGGAAPGDSQMVGKAPNGEPLYAAEWYREPTDQQLSTYLPKTMPDGGGWGTVACRTEPRFRVGDCVEIDQNPAGSHLAGAVRQAAWQFLVRPPRVGGKTLVGEWVQIRIYYGMNRRTE